MTLLARRAHALAQAGRLEEAAVALDDGRRELETYKERYAEPTLLLADAVLRHARGDEPAAVAKVLAEAAGVAGAQGGHAMRPAFAPPASGWVTPHDQRRRFVSAGLPLR